MTYLGIKNDEMKGLYYFETISVRDESKGLDIRIVFDFRRNDFIFHKKWKVPNAHHRIPQANQRTS